MMSDQLYKGEKFIGLSFGKWSNSNATVQTQLNTSQTL